MIPAGTIFHFDGQVVETVNPIRLLQPCRASDFKINGKHPLPTDKIPVCLGEKISVALKA